jgi:hypothetical protein
MKTLFEYLYNFLFNRWTSTVIEEGIEDWSTTCNLTGKTICNFNRSFVKYKLTNKFDQSEKIEKVYLN